MSDEYEAANDAPGTQAGNVHVLTPPALGVRQAEKLAEHDLVNGAVKSLDAIGRKTEADAVAFLIEVTNHGRLNPSVPMEPVSDAIVKLIPFTDLAAAVMLLQRHRHNEQSRAVDALVKAAVKGVTPDRLAHLPMSVKASPRPKRAVQFEAATPPPENPAPPAELNADMIDVAPATPMPPMLVPELKAVPDHHAVQNHREILDLKDQLDRINLEQCFTNDPVEKMIGDALTAAGYEYEYETHPNRRAEVIPNTPILDFKIVDGPYIEVKRMASPRSAKQLETQSDVILIQGIEAAQWFCAALKPKES